MILPALAAAALLLAAEPAPRPAPPAAAAGGEAACTATLSGAVSGTFTCVVEASFDEKRVVLAIKADGDVAGVKALLPARFELPPPLEARTYTLATLGAGEARVVLASGAEYVASGARGEVTLEVVGLERYVKPRARYQISGTLKARLVPTTPGATGEVHLEARF